jgi:hypothetical protein
MATLLETNVTVNQLYKRSGKTSKIDFKSWLNGEKELYQRKYKKDADQNSVDFIAWLTEKVNREQKNKELMGKIIDTASSIAGNLSGKKTLDEELDNPEQPDNTKPKGTILGIPTTLFYVGAALIVVISGIGVYYAIKKAKK